MNIIGIDLGTTTLSAVVLDSDSGAVLETVNLANAADTDSVKAYERIQNPEVIADKALGIVSLLKARYRISAIGIDGQMHGVLYVDRRGRAVSPLFTWQDQRGEERLGDASYAEELSRRTGYHLATGFGMTTHFWHTVNDCIPKGATKLCTIYDYVGMRLTGRTEPLMHVSTAASLGLVNPEEGDWDAAAMGRGGIDRAFLPKITGRCVVQGCDPDGIPIACGIGDNQASFIGSVRDMAGSVLVNIGTGGQISMLGARQTQCDELETRPLGEGKSITVGATLCGGRSYALLERFLRSCVRLSGAAEQPLYEAMNRIGLELLEDDDLPLVDTHFDGTRANPEMRGSISGIGTRNFDAGRLVAGTVAGITREIHDLYGLMLAGGMAPANQLIGSGNAIRLNPALKRAFENIFGMEMYIPVHDEEAAYGAALCGMVAAGIKESLEQAQKLIAYVSGD